MDEVVTVLEGGGAAVLTCEHAGGTLPAPWTWPEGDRRLIGTHWAQDLGVEAVARALHRATGWPAVLAGFSRLLVDPNRRQDHPDLFRSRAEGRPVHLNAELTEAERTRRLERLWRPYHQAVDAQVQGTPGATVVSLHSFTPLYEGRRRTLELGVLFDEDEDLAREVASALRASGWIVRLNEPYSGREGLMSAARDPALRHGRAALELELRQDLLADAATRARLVEDTRTALQAVLS